MTANQTTRPIATIRIWASGYWIAEGIPEFLEDMHPVVTPVDETRGWKMASIPPDAFLEFVTACHTEADVERLANRYGLLGTERQYDRVFFSDDTSSILVVAEPVSTWLGQAQELRELWQDWRDLQDPTTDVQSRTLALWDRRTYNFFDEPAGLPVGPPAADQSPDDTEKVGPDPGRLPVRLLDYSPPETWEEAKAATQAHVDAKAAADRVKSARAALDKLNRTAPSRRPDDYRRRRTEAATALSVARRAERLARRQCDFTARQLGWTLLGRRVTEQLRRHKVAPTLVKSSLKTLVRVRQSRGPAIALEHYAPTLLALLWLQLADAMSQSVEYRRCAGCPNYITIHPDAHRKHKTTCSDACRQRVWRAEKPRHKQKKQKANRRSKKKVTGLP